METILTDESKDDRFKSNQFFTSQLLARIKSDPSAWSLVFSNVLVAYWAISKDWPLTQILLTYWTQSVIIGVFNFFKILSLKNFSTEGIKIGDEPIASSSFNKIYMAFFFLIHYGIFHLAYLMFIGFGGFFSLSNFMDFTANSNRAGIDFSAIVYPSFVFLLNHLFSFVLNLQKDRKRIVNVGKIFAKPYARIIPMHLTIIFGGFLGFLSGAGASITLVFFLGIKTFADLAMHVNEHKE